MLMVKEKNFYKTFFSLTLGIALQNVIVYTVNLADNIMLGKFTEEALSGVALVNQIQFLLQMLVTGVAEGALIFTARSWGEHDIPSIKKVTSIAQICGLAVSGLMFILALAFPSGILSILSNNTAVVAQGTSYFKIICFSYPIFAISQIFLSTLRSVETVKIGFATAIATLICNVILNYIFIFGNFGAPRLGAQGAAIATLCSRILELLIVLVYFLHFDKKIKMKAREFLSFDRPLFRSYLKNASPVFFSGAMWGIAQMLQTAILGHTTQAAIAANSIATTVFSIVSVFTYASATATSVVIGKTIGEGKTDRIKPYSKTLQVLFLLIGLATGAVLIILKNPIISFYDISEEAKTLSNIFMIVLAVTVIGTSYQMACNTGIVRAGGDTKFLLRIDTIFMWGLVLPLSFLSAFVFGWPVPVTFICLKCDQILKCFVSFRKVNSYNWIKILK